MAAKFDKSLLKRVKMLVLDVDGVLTDGRIYVSSSGEETLAFDVKDGMGVTKLIAAGIKVAILSARKSPVVPHRAKMLGIETLMLGERDKLSALKKLAESLKIGFDEMAYIGDDIADVECLKAVAFSAAPSDAIGAAHKAVKIRLKRRGGRGAVRELADLILQEKSKSL